MQTNFNQNDYLLAVGEKTVLEQERRAVQADIGKARTSVGTVAKTGVWDSTPDIWHRNAQKAIDAVRVGMERLSAIEQRIQALHELTKA